MSTLVVTERDGAVSFEVRVVPRASRDAIAGVHGQALKVSLSAPPVEGAANEALIALLARALSVPKRTVELVRGEQSRTKLVRITGVTAAQLHALAQSKT